MNDKENTVSQTGISQKAEKQLMEDQFIKQNNRTVLPKVFSEDIYTKNKEYIIVDSITCLNNRIEQVHRQVDSNTLINNELCHLVNKSCSMINENHILYIFI